MLYFAYVWYNLVVEKSSRKRKRDESTETLETKEASELFKFCYNIFLNNYQKSQLLLLNCTSVYT